MPLMQYHSFVRNILLYACDLVEQDNAMQRWPNKKREERERGGGHMRKFSLTELVWIERENIWLLVTRCKPHRTHYMLHYLEQNVFLVFTPTESISS